MDSKLWKRIPLSRKYGSSFPLSETGGDTVFLASFARCWRHTFSWVTVTWHSGLLKSRAYQITDGKFVCILFENIVQNLYHYISVFKYLRLCWNIVASESCILNRSMGNAEGSDCPDALDLHDSSLGIRELGPVGQGGHVMVCSQDTVQLSLHLPQMQRRHD